MCAKKLTMADLQTGESGVILSDELSGRMRKRLTELGLISGTRVSCVMKSPNGDMSAFYARGTVTALRKEDLQKINIMRIN